MAFRNSGMGFAEKLSRDIELDESRSQILKKTYLLLSIAIIGMVMGGNFAMNTPALLNLFTGITGWILAMVALNAVPMIAMRFSYNPIMGTAMLFADGFVAGLILGPMLWVAEMLSGTQIVTSAAWITGAIFVGITGYVYFSGVRWAPSRAIYSGMFFAIIGAVVLNMLMPMGFLGMLIAAAIGAMGVVAIVSSTSEILNNHEIDTPVPGALMLFGGVFMIFQSVLFLLISFTGGSRD